MDAGSANPIPYPDPKCRCCSKADVRNIPIWTNSKYSCYTIAQVLEFVMKEKITLEGNCSNYICESCLNKLEKYCDFKANFINNEHMNELTSMMQELEKNQMGGTIFEVENQNHVSEDSGIEDRPRTPGPPFIAHSVAPNQTLFNLNSIEDRNPFLPPKHNICKLVEYCTDCDRGYSSLATYATHLEQYHTQKLCQICGDFFTGVLGLKSHEEVRH